MAPITGGARVSFFSLLGQAAILGLLIYFTSCVIRGTPEIADHLPKFNEFTSGVLGTQRWRRRQPRPASGLARQSAQGFARSSTRAADGNSAEGNAEASGGGDSNVAPDIRLPQGGQIGDPTSEFSRVLSNGPGGPGGIGPGMLRRHRTFHRAGSWPGACRNLSGGQAWE